MSGFEGEADVAQMTAQCPHRTSRRWRLPARCAGVPSDRRRTNTCGGPPRFNPANHQEASMKFVVGLTIAAALIASSEVIE